MAKVGVFIPVHYQGGTLRLAKTVAKMIQFEAKRRGDDIQVVFGNSEGKYSEQEDLWDLIEAGIEIRPFRMKSLSNKEAAPLVKQLTGDFPLVTPRYCVPDDGASGYLDCDLWFFVADRIFDVLIPLRKTAIFSADYIQRYVPQIFDRPQFEDPCSPAANFIRNARNADYLFVSSPGTYQDARAYVGKAEGLVFYEPIFDPDFLLESDKAAEEHSPFPFPYVIWVTNGTMHKNHARAASALREYYGKLGGKLKIVVTGVNTHFFSPEREKMSEAAHDHPYHASIRKQISESAELRGNLIFPGNVSDREYRRILRNARFLWHNVIADNGTYSVIEAAYCGVPALSSDYPQQRFIDHHYALNMTFFDPFDPSDAARKLKQMEETRPVAGVDTEVLKRRSWQALAPHHYNIVRNCIEQPRRTHTFYS